MSSYHWTYGWMFLDIVSSTVYHDKSSWCPGNNYHVLTKWPYFDIWRLCHQRFCIPLMIKLYRMIIPSPTDVISLFLWLLLVQQWLVLVIFFFAWPHQAIMILSVFNSAGPPVPDQQNLLMSDKIESFTWRLLYLNQLCFILSWWLIIVLFSSYFQMFLLLKAGKKWDRYFISKTPLLTSGLLGGLFVSLLI